MFGEIMLLSKAHIEISHFPLSLRFTFDTRSHLIFSLLCTIAVSYLLIYYMKLKHLKDLKILVKILVMSLLDQRAIP